MKITKDSHVDHGISKDLLSWIEGAYADRQAFFIDTVDVSKMVPATTVPCGLYGPLMGDAPVLDGEVEHAKRGNRAYTSRVVRRPMREVQKVTVIAGPHGDDACILYTAFGGPLTPKEPNDPTLEEAKRGESLAFWSTHALALVE